MRKVRKAVITAAGRGTRQYPASSAVQKEMFPLVDRDGLTKPVIQIVVEEAIDSGIEEICIITQPGEERLYRDYFRRLDDVMIKAFKGKDWAIRESEKQTLATRDGQIEPDPTLGFSRPQVLQPPMQEMLKPP